MFDEDTQKIIRGLPKLELHIHSEAVVTLSSYHDLNTKNKVNQSLKTIQDYDSLLHIKSLKDMIANFLFLQTLFRSPEDFMFMVRDVEKYCAANNIPYIELHLSPTMVLRSGYVSFDDFITVIVDGFDELERRGGPDARIIIDLSRSYGLENARGNLAKLLAFLGKKPTRRIIGVGLGGQEMGNPCLTYAGVLADAREAGLHVVVHAGEEVGPESIWQAVRDVGADRIGHGTSAVFDPSLMDYLKEHSIPLEVCPTSNIITGKYVQTYEKHPIKQFMDEGLFVTGNTDDPMLFDIDLNREYESLARTFNIEADTLIGLAENAIRASFMDDKSKQSFTKRLREAVSLLK